jgi:hypothetical protein
VAMRPWETTSPSYMIPNVTGAVTARTKTMQVARLAGLGGGGGEMLQRLIPVLLVHSRYKCVRVTAALTAFSPAPRSPHGKHGKDAGERGSQASILPCKR